MNSDEIAQKILENIDSSVVVSDTVSNITYEHLIKKNEAMFTPNIEPERNPESGDEDDSSEDFTARMKSVRKNKKVEKNIVNMSKTQLRK